MTEPERSVHSGKEKEKELKVEQKSNSHCKSPSSIHGGKLWYLKERKKKTAWLQQQLMREETKEGRERDKQRQGGEKDWRAEGMRVRKGLRCMGDMERDRESRLS